MPDEPTTYSDAGVDIDAAHSALRSLRSAIVATHDQRVIEGPGGFGGLFEATFPEMRRPVLVSSVDGVGTKTTVARMAGDYGNIGRDIVNHCVNDVLCQGARPLFFMDYFGCSRLDPDVLRQVVTGAAAACQDVGCALIGGENAEMPGVYHEGEADVVGCIVGVVEHDNRLPSQKVKEGDRLVGIASDGLHTNGFSLARRALFEVGGVALTDAMPGTDITYGEALLAPHRCYFRPLEGLIADGGVLALAHITGGGIYENLPRALPQGLGARVSRAAWRPQQVFKEIQRLGGVDDREMHRAFNMGVGMVAVVGKDSVDTLLLRLTDQGETATDIGEVSAGPHEVTLV